ncbi:MAG: endonuclease [Candidatus Woesearchaeota archaeon]|nr:endonuclease [Candidatus Woesearchaeota archaeon]MDN5327713.1 endonuclease [Candidatus Woesearchaeota archaeon]
MKPKISNENIGQILLILGNFVKQYQVPAVSQFKKNPFTVLMSTILSLRTKDAVTIEASKRLFEKVKNCDELEKMSVEELAKIIYPVGFYKTKARRLKEICNVLKTKFNGRIPATLEELLTLPGVGRKTANLVLTEGFGKEGICVDTHVHRISNRWGFVNTKTPEQTEFALRKKLPKKYWIEYNRILVTFGQNVCLPVSPLCSKCPIENFCIKKGVMYFR